MRPHRWQPTRLPHPWDSPGKNTGVGCHCLLQCMKVKSEKWSLSVMSDSSRPHGLQPTRLLRPWDFPDKSTGVGCHCLLWNVPLVTHKRMWMTFVTTSKNHGGNKMTMSTCWAVLKQSINGFKDFISLFPPLFCLFYPPKICIHGRTTFSERENMCYFCFMTEGTSGGD